jgi:transketolase
MWREQLQKAAAANSLVLPACPVIWTEAGVSTGWRAIARDHDKVVGLDRFGESGPGPQVAAHLGLTPGAIANAALTALGRGAQWD